MLTNRFRGVAVTPALTYKGHTVEVYDEGSDTGAEVQVINDQDIRVAIMTAATVSTRDGSAYRAEGTADGEPAIWRVSKMCARCATPAVYATPVYDVPR